MRLSQQDASFLYTETASGPMQTAGILVIDGELSFEEIYKFYVDRLHLVPRLLQRLVFVPMNLAHPKWVQDPDFDPKNHFVHHAMPKGSTVEDGLDALAKLNEGIMDRNLPLWKFFVVTGIKNRTLILQQMHHAMIDGASGVQMATLLFDYEPNAPEPEPAPERPPAPPLQNSLELMAEAMQENMTAAMSANPANLLTGSQDSQRHLQKGFETMTRFMTNPSITAPWNASAIGPARKLRWSQHALSEFREIRRAFGGTINDIALTTVSEGAARYLKAHDETTEGANFRIMCPVNVRTEGQQGDLGNQVSAIFPMLPASPMKVTERLQTVIAETSRIKESQEAQAMTFMQEAVSIPAMTMAPTLLVGTPFDPTRFAADNPAPVIPPFGPRPPGFGVNFVLTNVPGVLVPQYIAGKEIIASLGIMMLTANMGLGVAVGSYNESMFFNLTADPRLIPDLDMFVDQVTGAFDELLEQARQTDKTAAA